MYTEKTKEENEARLEILKANWQVDIIETRDLLDGLDVGDDMTFEFEKNNYNVLKLEEGYYILETPKDIVAGWRVGDLYSYSNDRLRDLVLMLVEEKY